MPLEEFIISVYCLIDDLYSLIISEPIRKRGTPPKLPDSEVLTMEIVTEWLGIHENQAIWTYFRRDWLHFFLTLLDRFQFVRQGANLWRVKQLLHKKLVQMFGADSSELQLTAANVDERDEAYDFLDDCALTGIDLQTPLRRNMRDERPKCFVSLVMHIRRRIETTIGQLVKYFDIEHCNCRDMWHLTSRMGRKLLACTI